MEKFHHFGKIAKKKSEAAGAKIGASMKKALSLASTQGIRIRKTKVFSKKSETDNREEKPEQLKNELDHELTSKQNYLQMPILETQEYDRDSPSISDYSGKAASPAIISTLPPKGSALGRSSQHAEGRT